MNRNSFYGYVGRGLPRPVIGGWFKAQERYVLQVDEAPWAFNERASISQLAAGCWLAGGSALEEFSTSKGHHDRRYLCGRTGRGDVYLSLGDNDYTCEAKWCQTAVPLPPHWDPETTVLVLKKHLLAAAHDAYVLDSYWSGRRRSLLFASIYFNQKVKAQFGVSEVQLLLSTAKKHLGRIGATGMAWYFWKPWMSPEACAKIGGKWDAAMGNLLFIGGARRKK